MEKPNESSFKDWNVGSRDSIEELLGEGRYGSVARAYDNERMFRVAIKKVSNPFQTQQHSIQIIRELMIFRRMEHPLMPTLHDLIIDGDEEKVKDVYFVMNLAEINLATLIQSASSLSIEEINSIAYDIACGLVYLHSGDVFHRDLKPGNMLIMKHGSAMLCDFGIARHLDKTHLNIPLGVLKRKRSEPVNDATIGKSDAISIEASQSRTCSRGRTDHQTSPKELVLLTSGLPGTKHQKCSLEKEIMMRKSTSGHLAAFKPSFFSFSLAILSKHRSALHSSLQDSGQRTTKSKEPGNWSSNGPQWSKLRRFAQFSALLPPNRLAQSPILWLLTSKPFQSLKGSAS